MSVDFQLSTNFQLWEMIDALSTVKGVKSVTSLGRKEDGSFDFLIEPEHGADVRAEVFKRIVSRGKTLLSLTSNKVSLEQIFLRLTEAADNDEAKRMLGITEKTETTEKPSVEIADASICNSFYWRQLISLLS